MTGRPDLADRLALALVEHGPVSGRQVARIVAARWAVVFAVLRDDPRFVQTGGGRYATWNLSGNARATLQGDASDRVMETLALHVLDRLDALERAVAELDHRLAAREETPAQ